VEFRAGGSSLKSDRSVQTRLGLGDPRGSAVELVASASSNVVRPTTLMPCSLCVLGWFERSPSGFHAAARRAGIGRTLQRFQGYETDMRRTCFGYETSHKRNMAHPRSRQALEVHWINEGRHHNPYNPCVGSLSPSAATKTKKFVKTNRRPERHAARHALRDDAYARLNGWPNHPETVDYLGGCSFPAHSVRAVDAWLCLVDQFVDQFETHIGGETGHAESGGDRRRRAAPDWARVGQSGPHNPIPGRHHDRPLDDRMVSVLCGCHGVGAQRRSSFHLAGFNALLAGGNRTRPWRRPRRCPAAPQARERRRW
jgi:hypothetical protein